jgi:hypothetical protein
LSTAILNVWITNLGDPSTIANDFGPGIPQGWKWAVAVLHCDGRVVNWSEGRFRHHHDDKWIPINKHTPNGGTPGWWYEHIPTRDGHVEIELPPGCYVVRASMHTWFANGVLNGNWATDHGIVRACCGEEACVTLYAPSFEPCDVILADFVLPLLMKKGIISREEGTKEVEALKAVLKKEKATSKREKLLPFELGDLETLKRAFNKMEEPPLSLSAIFINIYPFY